MTEQVPLFKSKFREQYPEFASWSVDDLLLCWKTRFGKEPVICTGSYDITQDTLKMSYSTEADEKIEQFWVDLSLYLFENKAMSVEGIPTTSEQVLKFSFHADR